MWTGSTPGYSARIFQSPSAIRTGLKFTFTFAMFPYGKNSKRNQIDNWPQRSIKSRHRHHHHGLRWGVPSRVEAREAIAEFQTMVRNKTDGRLAIWIERARNSLIASFANGVAKDEPAVRRDHDAVVQRADGRSDHQAQAGQTTDVWSGQDRSTSGSADRGRGQRRNCKYRTSVIA